MATTSKNVCGFKTFRHRQNPDEKVFHDTFIRDFINTSLNGKILNHIIFQTTPESNWRNVADNLTEREIKIIISTIQWLGSPVGKSFLTECGFEKITE
jgi:hypothetical protein